MIAEIICVGTELLLGQILNTNAQYLSQKLAEYGIDLYFQTVVGDNIERIKYATNLAANRADILIFTGGLGPTQDDITKEAVCSYFNLPMYLDENVLSDISSYFEKRERPMPEAHKKKAMLPIGAKILPNHHGTAPGVMVESNKKTIIFLPGPPFELIPMFESYVEPYLNTVSQYKIYSRVLKFMGIGESSIEEELEDLFSNQSDPTLALYAKSSEVTLRISTKKMEEEKANEILDDMELKIRERLNEYIYGIDNQTIEEVVVDLLMKKSLVLAVAESCTGGLISSKITDVPGASNVFDRSFITYSNEAKVNLLKVNEQTLKDYGAVSKEVCIQMARGAILNSKANVALSVTGIAGPTGATEKKPVGLVFVGFSDGKNSDFCEYRFLGERKRIKELAACYALDFLRKKLLKNY